jgi:hypothetical protein
VLRAYGNDEYADIARSPARDMAAGQIPDPGNADWIAAARLDREALDRAATAAPAPDDKPEWAKWIEALRDPKISGGRRDEIMYAIHDLFEPEDE